MLFAILSSQRGFVHYFKTHFLDNTFKGLYKPNAFDLLLLIPYFVVMAILAAYGIHRYMLVFMYYKNRKKHAGEPTKKFAELPRVTVQLPIFNEQFVVDRLVEAICKLEYPKDKLDIQVLDDSTDETKEVAQAVVERYAALGHPISYIHRTNREGFKAGALENGLKTAKGEFVAIFDADFVPPEDWLLRVIHHFAEPQIGMAQTRWTHLNRNYSFLTEVEAIMLDGHFILDHGARYRSGVFFNFNGTAGMWRRKAIEEAGGWQHDTLTEDTDLSYRAQLKGWKFKYLQDIECPAELPIEMTAFKIQQARWAKGLVQTGKKLLPQIFRSNVPWRVKVEAWYHLSANISYPLMIVLSTLLLPAMIIRSFGGWFQMLVIDLPLFLASTCSISSFYLVAQKELRPKTWWRTFLYMPFVMATGIGISVRNAQAVIEALVGKKSEFARTPKYKIEGKKDSFVKKSYKNKVGWMPFAEIVLGLYFAFTVVYAITNENYATVPFLLLFVWGYLYTGFMSLGQKWFAHLRFGVNAPEMRPAASGAPGF